MANADQTCPVHRVNFLLEVVPSKNGDWFETFMRAVDTPQSSREALAMIPTVPQNLFPEEYNREHFFPRVVSIGPYHHGKLELKPMEKLKIRIAGDFVRWKKGIRIEELYKRVEDLAAELRTYYTEKSTENFDDTQFTRMMFLDACFVLNFSAIFNMKMKGREQHSLYRDLILLENQLPYKLLCSIGDTSELNALMAALSPLGYTYASWRWKPSSSNTESIPVASLLDLFSEQATGIRSKRRSNGKEYPGTRIRHSAKELSIAGIRFERSTTIFFNDVRFRSGNISGVLTLPQLIIDDHTKTKILNLVAYEERLGKKSVIGVTNYICFLKGLIGHADDVKLLSSAGVLVCYLSDEEVVGLINGLARELVPRFNLTYYLMFVKIEEYFTHGRKTRVATWLAEVKRDHFSSPWTAIVLFAALYTILLTTIQTYFSVFPVQK